MVVIRLSRTGAKKNPFYHVVVADQRFPRDGRFIERLGYFNPVARGKATRLLLDQERVQHWISQGATPSDRIAALMSEFKKGTSRVRPTLSEQRMEQSRSASALAAKKAKEDAAAAAKATETEAAAAQPSEE